MNTTDQQLPPSVSGTQDEQIQIAIHISIVREPRAVAVGLVQPMLLLTLAAGLFAALRREGLVNEAVGSQGDGCDGYIAFMTASREAALQIVKGYFAKDVSPFHGWATIAWYEPHEEMWRLVQQGNDQRPFEERVTEEAHAVRRAIAASALQMLDSFLTPPSQTSL